MELILFARQAFLAEQNRREDLYQKNRDPHVDMYHRCNTDILPLRMTDSPVFFPPTLLSLDGNRLLVINLVLLRFFSLLLDRSDLHFWTRHFWTIIVHAFTADTPNETNGVELFETVRSQEGTKQARGREEAKTNKKRETMNMNIIIFETCTAAVVST